jgi:hypothetical protein
VYGQWQVYWWSRRLASAGGTVTPIRIASNTALPRIKLGGSASAILIAR